MTEWLGAGGGDCFEEEQPYRHSLRRCSHGVYKPTHVHVRSTSLLVTRAAGALWLDTVQLNSLFRLAPAFFTTSRITQQ